MIGNLADKTMKKIPKVGAYLLAIRTFWNNLEVSVQGISPTLPYMKYTAEKEAFRPMNIECESLTRIIISDKDKEVDQLSLRISTHLFFEYAKETVKKVFVVISVYCLGFVPCSEANEGNWNTLLLFVDTHNDAEKSVG
jgi:hypothetical protein